LEEETGVPGENHRTCRKSLTNFITYCCIEYTSPSTGFELTTIVVIGTDFTVSCKSNYHTITSRHDDLLLYFDSLYKVHVYVLMARTSLTYTIY